MHALTTEPVPSQARSIIDGNNPRELTRQLQLQQLLASVLGIFPATPERAHVRSVLDIWCGPGSWALETAYQYPHLKVTGIDTNHRMITFARAQARARGLSNVYFEVVDQAWPLPFREASFDLINGRLLSAFLLARHWEPLLAECMRILRPGGSVCLTEFEPGTSSCLAHNELRGLFLKAMFLTGRSFSPDGQSLGFVIKLRPLLQQSGFVDIWTNSHHLEYSHGSPLHEPWTQDLLTLTELIMPFLVESGVATASQVYDTSGHLAVQMLSPQFCAYLTCLIACGTKPPCAGNGHHQEVPALSRSTREHGATHMALVS
jgi:ubiquinone/menaquinone biosynthesis C-methylase UbiE